MSTSTDTPTARAELNAPLNLQRKAAIARGGAFDHAGRLQVERMANFDMGRTIFGGLEGIARKVMDEKLAKESVWDRVAAADIEAAYAKATSAQPAPAIDQRLIDFMVNECDFSMEHADGTFLEHLVFCHHYAARYYPGHSPNVALLHSILGTATNTFAMEARKLPQLKALLTDFEALHVEAFPSILRLLYNDDLLEELEQNMHRLGELKSLRLHRVIDNEPLTIDADNLWINLNYHLMHFVDFMPSANWSTHRADPLLQMFERLSSLLDRAGQRQARVEVEFPETKAAPVGENRSLFGRFSDGIPPAVKLTLARKAIRKYSELAGHDLSFQLEWKG
ncbi:hypothetical protein LPB72_17550 [Hydrogenophaga crassostreae]|uniref:Uncharacterized protein n=1 Tax=Hydrogenophaga crassostreae TaxID=1763535 RepID=A0A162YT54_9BURK|nr:hypothetical protein [Hydrogenophaga crassostreae]AOW12804.1 hypothetical protein LPB072_08055 [Hydrogenophaga crassostreae]OAD39992.1 hypothetical protein LPB72_17550 [Hydrogenophaga crassostreae]